MKKKSLEKIIIIIGVTLIVYFSLMLIGNKMRTDAVKEQEKQKSYYEWLIENCECAIKDRFFCSDGFVLTGTRCYKNATKTYSNRLIGCSKYECSEGVAIWNNLTLKWEDLQ